MSRILFRERVVSQHALQVSRPTPGGEVEGSGWEGLQVHTQVGWGCAQAHTQGVSRTTPMGGLQAHTQGGCFPACTEAHTTLPQQTATAAGGTHPTGMHSCLMNSLVCSFTYWLNRIILEYLLYIFMDRNYMLFLSMLHCDH